MQAFELWDNSFSFLELLGLHCFFLKVVLIFLRVQKRTVQCQRQIPSSGLCPLGLWSALGVPGNLDKLKASFIDLPKVLSSQGH